MKDNSQCKWCVQRARCQASHRRPSGTLLLGKYRKYRKQMHDNEPRYCWKCCYFRISLRSSVTNNHSHRFARIIKNRLNERTVLYTPYTWYRTLDSLLSNTIGFWFQLELFRLWGRKKTEHKMILNIFLQLFRILHSAGLCQKVALNKSGIKFDNHPNVLTQTSVCVYVVLNFRLSWNKIQLLSDVFLVRTHKSIKIFWF